MSIVLIAEDDALLRNLYGKVLKHAGHTLLYAQSCADTLAQLETEVPDVVVLDMTMPDGTSWPILEYMRSHERFQKTHIIVVTGNRQFERRVTEHGADYFLSKPVPARVLAESVARFSV